MSHGLLPNKGLKPTPCRARAARGYAAGMDSADRTDPPLTRAQLERDVRRLDGEPL